MKGEFHHALGVTPNNITDWGATALLQMAFQGTDITLWVGLCSGVFTPDLQIGALEEPTIGVNGYARQPLTRSVVDWPVTGITVGSPFIESKQLTWTPAGGAFDKLVTRMFICADDNDLAGNVFALSAAMHNPMSVTAALSAKYRLYAR